jgi:hypothetical protein
VGLLLLLLLLRWFSPRKDGEGALNVVVSGVLSGLDESVAAEGLLMGLRAADGVEGGEGDYCPDAGVDGGGRGEASHRWVGWIWVPGGRWCWRTWRAVTAMWRDQKRWSRRARRGSLAWSGSYQN